MVAAPWEPCRRALELLRRTIAQRRVQPDAIVVLVDEGFDVRAQMLEIPIVVGVDLLPLERFHEALAAGVVVGVRRPTHARDHLVLAEQLHVCAGGILHAPIGMMHHARRRLSLCDGLVQRAEWQPGRQRRSSAQPTTLRENPSRITAR